MTAVSNNLLHLLSELQSLDVVDPFALAGGTNLALRFAHRKSIDIDLFTSEQLGIKGLELLRNTLSHHFQERLITSTIVNKETGDQYAFLRCLVKVGDEQIKVEFLQNFQHLDAFDNVNGIRMFTIRDVGLFKLMSTANRKAQKDIYDLDFITEHYPLQALLAALKEKQERFCAEKFHCLFDLDDEESPVDNVRILLPNDNNNRIINDSRPLHTNDRLEIIAGNKSWYLAKRSWEKKVKQCIQTSS